MWNTNKDTSSRADPCQNTNTPHETLDQALLETLPWHLGYTLHDKPHEANRKIHVSSIAREGLDVKPQLCTNVPFSGLASKPLSLRTWVSAVRAGRESRRDHGLARSHLASWNQARFALSFLSKCLCTQVTADTRLCVPAVSASGQEL